MFKQMRRVMRQLAAVCVVLSISACGGGGGGGGGTPNTPNPPTGGNRGGFTLSATSASFSVERFSASPAPPVALAMHLTGSAIATVGAAYREGVQPASWLTVTITGQAPDFIVSLQANETSLPIAQYVTTISIGTADQNNNILEYRDVQVTYSIVDGISVSGGPLSVEATLGHSTSTSEHILRVQTEAQPWVVSADVPWIVVPNQEFEGAGAANVTIDTSSLAIGMHTATITVVNTDNAADSSRIPVTVNVNRPALNVNIHRLPFGGYTGLDPFPRAADVVLMTGSALHPLSASFVPSSGGEWLTIDLAPSEINATGGELTLTPHAAQLAAGTYTGELVVTADVNSTLVSTSVPVTLNVDEQRIWASSNGVGLSSFPSRDTLTRTLRVFNSLERDDLQLQVSSDQAWLSVSSPGPGSIELTAAADALTTNQLHTATVTVSSPDPRIVNEELIRVGLWRGSSDPVDLTLPVMALYMAASPVEPLVFTNDGQSDIQVFNVYSGALVRTLTDVAPSLGPMAFSSDGRVLYSSDDSTKTLIAIDPVTGSILRTYPTMMDVLWGTPLHVAYARPEGHAILISGATGQVFDEASQTLFVPSLAESGTPVVSKDGHRIYVQNANGISPSAITLTQVRYSSRPGMGLVGLSQFEWSGHFDEVYMPSNGQDIALTDDDRNLYRASGAPYGFGVVDPNTLVGRLFLPATAYTAAVECGWRGFCFGSAGPDWNTDQDVWIYDNEQVEQPGLVLGAQNLTPRGLSLSADDTRLIASITVPSDQWRLAIRSTPE